MMFILLQSVVEMFENFSLMSWERVWLFCKINSWCYKASSHWWYCYVVILWCHSDVDQKKVNAKAADPVVCCIASETVSDISCHRNFPMTSRDP